MLRKLLLVALFLGMGMVHAQTWQVGDYDTLWYYDEATGNFFQGVFKVEAVTPHFYIMSEQRTVEGVERLFGIPGLTPFGIVTEGVPSYFNGPAWTPQGLYSNVVGASPSDIHARVLGTDTLLVVAAGVRVGLGPSSPGQNWSTGRVKTFPEQITVADVAPLSASSASGAAVFAGGGGHLYRATLQSLTSSAWGDTFFLVPQDLFVSDFFTPNPPYADTNLVANGWQVSGSVSWDQVLVGGTWYDVIRASAGASLTKSFSLPLPLSAFALRFHVLPRQGDQFALNLEDQANQAVFAFRAAQDTLYLDLPDTTVALVALGTLREAFLLEVFESEGELVVRVNGRESLRRTWDASGVSSPVRVHASISAGELILESMDITLPITAVAGLPGQEGVLVGTPAGLFRYTTANGWSATGFQGAVDRIYTFAQNTSFVGVLSGGAIFVSSDGGSSFSPWNLPAAASELRDVAFSPTSGSEAIVATDAGFFHTTDGGQTWHQVFSYLSQMDPQDWVQDARGVIWDGGQNLLVYTLAGLFYSDQGLDSLKEWDYSGVDPYFVYPSQIADLQFVLEDSVFTLEPDSGSQVQAQGLFEAVRQVLGDPGQDIDGDPRVVLLLTNLRYQLPPGSNGPPDRVPFFESVNPQTWTRSSFANRHEVIELDNAHLDQDVFVPLDFLAREGANPQLPNGFNAVVRALAKYFVYSHRVDQERWMVEGIARYVDYAIQYGEANPDVGLTAFPSDPEIGLTVWPQTWKLPPTKVTDTRNFKYVFLQFLRENYPAFSVRDLVQSGLQGLEYIEQTTGKTLGELFREFANQAVFGSLAFLPNLSYSPLGLNARTDQPLAPYTFITRRAQAGRSDLIVDTLWLNGLPGDPVEYAVYHRFPTGDSVIVTGVVDGFGDAVLAINDTIRRGEALMFMLLWAEGDSGARKDIGLTTVTSWYSKPTDGFAPAPTFSYVILQDPLLETRVQVFGFSPSDEPLFAEFSDWVVGTTNPEGLGIREIEPQDFGFVDTSFRAVLPVSSPYITGGHVYAYTTDITARGKELYLFARDSLGRAVVDAVEQLQFLTLSPGVAAVHEQPGLRVEIPAGAVRETRLALVRSMDGANPALAAAVQFPEQPVRVVQVGSYQVLDREAVLSVADAEGAVRAWVYTPAGWEEIPVEHLEGGQVRIYTTKLGLIALTGGTSFSPRSLRVKLLSPVVRGSEAFQFEVATPADTRLTMSLVDPLGRRVARRSVALASGYHRVRIPARFAPGIYFLKVQVGETTMQHRVVVLP